MKRFKKILFGFFIAILFIPIIQQNLKLFNIDKLNGSFHASGNPKFFVKKLMSGEFQKSYESFINENFGFRNIFVRLHNQIEYSIFNKSTANDVVIGKEGYLYEEKYIRALQGLDFIGENKIDSLIHKAKFLQDTLQKLNINLVLVFAPSKARFFPEYIPDKYKIDKNAKTNYDYFIKSCKKQKVEFVDFNGLFVKSKDTSKYPLYPQCGTHWSVYSFVKAADSLRKFIEKKRNVKLNRIIYTGVEISDSLHDPDCDMGKALNLFSVPKHYAMAYPKYYFENNKNNNQPKVLTIADSYYYGIYMTRIPKFIFKYGGFWYYYKQVFPKVNNVNPDISELNIYKEILNQDVIFIMNTECNLNNFSSGFIDDAYLMFNKGIKYYSQIKDSLDYEKKIVEMENNIKGQKEWYNKIIKQAQKLNRPVDEMLRENAKFMLSSKK